jgi:quercetin dioxygenase-like cupin family protein/mannose-6-phosphate isomerase-like protein (cupin superfamily)
MTRLVVLLGLATVMAAGAALRAHAEIPMQKLELATGQSSAPGAVSIREVLPREIEGVVTDAVSMVGPAQHVEPASTTHEVVWLFLGGKGTLHANDQAFEIADETIARAPLGWSWRIQVPAGEALHAVRVRKLLSAGDRAELRKFPDHNASAYVRTFRECATYGEAIKSAKTVSRTLLPENYVPRMAVGTVETVGPDKVAPHRHPMLEQLFLGLKDNQITVLADEAKATLTPLSILHIPLGSNHGAEVAEGQKMRYVWIDFFTTKEGQEWLKTHKPLASDKEPLPSPAPRKKP